MQSNLSIEPLRICLYTKVKLTPFSWLKSAVVPGGGVVLGSCLPSTYHTWDANLILFSRHLAHILITWCEGRGRGRGGLLVCTIPRDKDPSHARRAFHSRLACTWSCAGHDQRLWSVMMSIVMSRPREKYCLNTRFNVTLLRDDSYAMIWQVPACCHELPSQRSVLSW